MDILEKEARDTPFAPGAWDKPDDFTSKKIDAFIHGRKINDPDYKCSHYEHQMKILSVAEGREEEIFNDPSFLYPIRRALNGETGRMSSILTSCYFNLYDELLKKKDISIEYDPDYTSKFIFNFLFHLHLDEESTKFIIPTVEFLAVKSILARVKGDRPRSPIFRKQWWDHYDRILDETIRSIRDKEWFADATKSDEMKWGIMLGYVRKPEDKEYIFYAGFEEGLWEYYPCYVSDNTTMNFSNYKKHRLLIRAMFLSPESLENQDIQCDPSSCMAEKVKKENEEKVKKESAFKAAGAAGGRRKTKKTKRRTYKNKKRTKPT